MSTFFDVIPNDIHDTIAFYLHSSIDFDEKFLSPGSLVDDKYLDTVLEYARNSPAQCCAVLRAMSGRLVVTNWRPERVTDWISISANHLLELDISKASRFSFSHGPPKLPKLRRATIGVFPEHLSLINASPKLTDLTVYATSTGIWDQLMSTIRSLPLKTLTLSFPASGGNVIKDLSKIELMGLAAACPAVEILRLYPGCEMTEDAWDMMKGLRSLKKMMMAGAIEGQYIPFLQSLSELELPVLRVQDVERFNVLLTGLGVVLLSDTEQILSLKSFPNLRELYIRVKPRAERALIGVMDNVKKLSLAFPFDHLSYQLEMSDGDYVDVEYPTYHQPDTADLRGIFRSVKKLKSFTVEHAILSSDAIESLLEVAGAELEELQMNHDWQAESVPNRLERILKAIVRYCPNLRILTFSESSSYSYSFIILATGEQKKRCVRALEEVRIALPMFESYRALNYTIRRRFTDQVPHGVPVWDHILH